MELGCCLAISLGLGLLISAQRRRGVWATQSSMPSPGAWHLRTRQRQWPVPQLRPGARPPRPLARAAHPGAAARHQQQGPVQRPHRRRGGQRAVAASRPGASAAAPRTVTDAVGLDIVALGAPQHGNTDRGRIRALASALSTFTLSTSAHAEAQAGRPGTLRAPTSTRGIPTPSFSSKLSALVGAVQKGNHDENGGNETPCRSGVCNLSSIAVRRSADGGSGPHLHRHGRDIPMIISSTSKPMSSSGSR
ncbi:unnamed protein product [Prorocentrum cordatum]|uniref:Uncharacterized protein n=1 Tax=Prorocentrum cordatum TaxID=2364126 RepID=A0ABN9T0K3_9DINO|nr:unnamed protein product [Polarella glacialis]